MKIGDIQIKHGIFLAPMAGYTDRAMRLVAKEWGCEYTTTEMVSAKAVTYGDKKTFKLGRIFDDEGLVALQIFGSEPEVMAEAAGIILRHEKELIDDGFTHPDGAKVALPVAFDINMGCPVNKIFSNGEGSALMRDPALAGKIMRAVVDAIDIPVTVKIRAGWDESSKNAPELARILEANGASAICVHARTKEQLYRPGIDIGIIKQVKASVSIPVIGNGDIYNAADAINMYEATGCDAIMIGRGTFGNPWIFEEILLEKKHEKT